MSTFVSTGDGCRMATTGSRGVTAVTSRRRSWHSLPSCYRASLPRRDERTGPQPLAARPLHVKRGKAFGVPPHSAAALVVQHYSPPRQAAPPAENTTGGHGCRSDLFALPLSPPLPESQTNSDIIHRSRGKRWSRCVQGPRTQEIRETGAGTEPSHRSVCPPQSLAPPMLRRHRSPPSGNKEGLAVNDICASR